VSRSADFPYTDKQRRWWFATHSETTKAFHGSPHKFDRFDESKAGSTTDAGELGAGLYFSTDRVVAEQYLHGYEVDLDLGKPLKISMPDWRTNKTRIVREALGLPLGATAAQVTEAAKAKGFDSVILDYSPAGYKQREIVVFDSDQARIRSNFAWKPRKI
jgi:hypothetical protein